MSRYVLDTSALLTVLNNEPGVETVVNILEAARSGEAQIYLPFIALMELEYLSLRMRSPEETQRVLTLVEAWPVEITDSTLEAHHPLITTNGSKRATFLAMPAPCTTSTTRSTSL